MATAIPETDEDVRLYECAILYAYPVTQKDEADLQKQVEEIFSDAGGKLILKDVWGQRGLAYSIGGTMEGNFIFYHYELDPAKVKEIDQQLRILRGVLRYLIVKPPKHYVVAPMANLLQKWQEESRLNEERRRQDKEEKLRKQVVEKAKRAPKAEKKPAVEKALPTETIEEGLEKLISDKDLEI